MNETNSFFHNIPDSPPSSGLQTLVEIKSFSSFLPPTYRVLLLVSFGLILSGVNFHILYHRGIDLWALLRTTSQVARRDLANGIGQDDDSSQDDANHNHGNSILPTLNNQTLATTGSLPFGGALPFYSFGFANLGWALLGWFFYRYYVDHLDGDPKGRHAQTFQGISVLGAVLGLVWPGNVLNRPIRRAFGRSFLRILMPSLNQTIVFSDVLFADTLTSFAKVLGDVWLTACFLVPRTEHHTWWNGKGSIAVPILISLPYAIRFRQCISEYLTTEPNHRKPLWNAAKYASSFPVIWLSAWYDADQVTGIQGKWNATYNLWLLSVFFNSLYSFWWDVTNDWGLGILQPSAALPLKESIRSLHRRAMSIAPTSHHPNTDSLPLTSFSSTNEKEKPTQNGLLSSSQSHHRNPSTPERILRPFPQSPPLLFSPSIYHFAILTDLVLRFFWSLKLSSHLHHIVTWQGGVFVMETLEILRRWNWVFFRVEWEVVRSRKLGILRD